MMKISRREAGAGSCKPRWDVAKLVNACANSKHNGAYNTCSCIRFLRILNLNLSLSHCHLSDKFIEPVIVLLIKAETVNISDRNNYCKVHCLTQRLRFWNLLFYNISIQVPNLICTSLSLKLVTLLAYVENCWRVLWNITLINNNGSHVFYISIDFLKRSVR